ncbi:TonB-dependent receptor [Filimonas effusa]|uniref:TonB-dependent receptor n=2 Tax=Filimonas effusa TaxID=2508721 RepID=A0A4Q1D680_9BACT|nr:TonB-dependent receptor [Filimonas effusa]
MFLLLASAAGAQQISGTVKDADNKPVTQAVVSLLRLSDSVILKNEVTDKGGVYEFVTVAEGAYFLSVSHIGYASAFSNVIKVGKQSRIAVPVIVLSKVVASLQGVTVTSKKPMIEVKADKTIVNVENTINAVGNDALELLRKSPGVMVDKDDNLSLSGKNGVQVFIDGKPSPFSGKDLAAYLRSLQSSEVESIELITNPSAKYEAAGNAGIINIRLKKNKAFGTNGSLSAGYNVGIFSKYNSSFAINHRNKKLNYYGSYNFNKARNESFTDFYRLVLDSVFDQHSLDIGTFDGNAFRGGVDYYANRNHTFGFVVMGNINSHTNRMRSNTEISYRPTGKTIRLLDASNNVSDERNNVNANFNYRFADTLGHELNIDADYGAYRLRTDQFQPNTYYTPSRSSVISEAVYRMKSPTDINTYAIKADYEQDYKKGKLSMGVKSSLVDADNDFGRYNVLSSKESMDSLRSNTFNYNENINAGYVNYNKQLKGVMVQVGLRVENTNAKGTSIGYQYLNGDYARYDSSFTRNYTDVFPSAAVTWNKDPANQWSLAYSRRIDRPNYQYLNPFEFKLDEYTYEKGNTRLNPQYTNSVRVTHVYKYMLTTALSYSHVSDIFSSLVDTAERSKAFISRKNLASQDVVNLNISLPVQIKKYSGFFNLSSSYSHYKAKFGEGRTVDLSAFNALLYMQHSYKFTKDITGEVSGFYNSPSIFQGTFKSRKMWGVDVGAQYSFMKGNMTLKATVSDVFQTMRWWGESDFAGQWVRANGGWESRLLKLNLSWRFGSSQVKAARQRKMATEEENKRINGDGGGSGGPGGRN